jgi:hypothetical protein
MDAWDEDLRKADDTQTPLCKAEGDSLDPALVEAARQALKGIILVADEDVAGRMAAFAAEQMRPLREHIASLNSVCAFACDGAGITEFMDAKAAHDSVNTLIERLAECYRLSGADPDGDEDWRLARHAVDEVRRLRKECDDADDENMRLREQLATSAKAIEVLDKLAKDALKENIATLDKLEAAESRVRELEERLGAGIDYLDKYGSSRRDVLHGLRILEGAERLAKEGK